MADKKFTVLDLLDLELSGHDALQLKCIAGRRGLPRAITIPEINRPGLLDHDSRISTIGTLRRSRRIRTSGYVDRTARFRRLDGLLNRLVWRNLRAIP